MTKRILRFISVTLTALIIIGLGGGIAWAMHTQAKQLPIKQYFSDHYTNSVWDWSNVTAHSDQDLKEQADFLHFHQLNTVYVDISKLSTFPKNGTKLSASQKQYEEHLQHYIEAMKKRDIRVVAAAGDVSWSNREKWQIPQTILANVYAYNARHPEASFVGMEFDIEAYNQSGFDTGSETLKSLILQDYLDLVDQIRNQEIDHYSQTKHSLEIGFAVPYWFDNENGNIPSVVHGAKKGPTLYHVVDSLSVLPKSNIVVMAYRNAAGGNDGVVAHSRTEVDYVTAKAPRVKVLIGQEVNDVEPAKITYYNTSLTELSSQVKATEDEFKDASGLGGIAINDLAGYRAFAAAE